MKISPEDKTRLTQELIKQMTDRLNVPTPSGVSNERVDAARAKRGLSPRMEPLREAFGESWTKAMKRVDDDPTAGTKLIKEIESVRTRKNALIPEETALLAHEQVRRENDFDGAVDGVNAAKNPAELAEAKGRLAAARDAVDEVYRAADRTGTWAGQALAARKILLNQDYTLARMEAMKRAANDGKPLTDKQAADVKVAFDALNAAKGKLDVVQQLADMQKELDLLKQLSTATGSKAKAIRNKLSAVAKTPLDNDALLERYKKSMATRQAALQAKIDAGDFTKNVRNKTRLDQEALDMQAAYKRVREKFEEGVRRDEESRRPLHERALEVATDFVRAGVISSPVAYGKLLAAAAARMIITPTEQLVGGALSLVPGISKVARLAPREGSLNLEAEGKALARAFTLGIGKDVWQTLKTGKSDLEILYGRPAGKPRGYLLDLLGRTHAAIKAPVLRAEFERSVVMLTKHYAANGVDVSDPMVRMDIAIQSFKNGEKAIFKNNNRATDAYKAALAGIERKNTRTGNTPALAKVLTSLVKTELPVVGVPTNIAAETMQYVFGSVTGSAKLAKAIATGVEKLHPDEADQIMRHLKKGALGAAVMALAFYADKDEFEGGGFYVKGERRKPGSVGADSMSIFGQQIDKHFLHNPYVLAMQMAASARRAADAHLHPDGKEKGIGGAALSALLGLTESVPFTKLFSDIHDSMDDNKRPRLLAEMLKNDLIPQAIQWEAKREDENAQDETIKRKADFSKGDLKGTIQTLKTGLPPSIKEITGGVITGRDTVPKR